MPKVSLIIPTFRRPQALLQALESVRAQSMPDWEAWVIDDGEGESRAAVAALADARIHWVHNVGSGQVDARNVGLCRASGDWIAFLDDDDAWTDPAHLTHVITAPPALVFRSGWFVTESGERTLFAPHTTAASLRKDNTLLASSIACPRHVLRRIGLLDRSMGSYWDWDWILRLLDLGLPLHEIATPGIAYAIAANTLSAVPDHPVRKAAFVRFCQKHNLHLTIKNHQQVARERAGTAK